LSQLLKDTICFGENKGKQKLLGTYENMGQFNHLKIPKYMMIKIFKIMFLDSVFLIITYDTLSHSKLFKMNYMSNSHLFKVLAELLILISRL
jgi:hypothetical protein